MRPKTCFAFSVDQKKHFYGVNRVKQICSASHVQSGLDRKNDKWKVKCVFTPSAYFSAENRVADTDQSKYSFH